MPEKDKLNNLIKEKSVYLLRHAVNPVNWHTWGDEAFKIARETKRPIFLSCGYSSCHWCRVMEEESFSDVEIGKIINEKFVAIKMDKDEFPDIDKEYQFYLQSTGESGGWPLTVFLTHDGDPFFAGTYFPKDASPDKPSFRNVLENIHKIWSQQPQEVAKVVQTRREFLKTFLKPEKPLIEGELALEYRKNEFKKIFDNEFGGFRQGAKFPYIPAMEYHLKKHDDPEIMEFLCKTADSLCVSAINDHLFGGFFRYTAGRKWEAPHFEKMLSDNSQIPKFLLQMYEITGNKLYLTMAKKAIDFVINNLMTDYGILNSVDADSVNDKGFLSEGYYYKVTDRDFSTLSQGELQNFPKDAGVDNGVIYLKTAEYLKAAAMNVSFEKVANRITSVKMPPQTDNKAIAGINFMFCTTLLTCFEISGEEWYLSQATALFQKLRHLLVDGSSVYRGCYGDEVINHTTLEDHVYYLEAILKFFEITKEKEFLLNAHGVVGEIESVFVRGGMPYLDKNHRILETFDDDKPNPAAQYMLLLKTYEYILHSPVSKEFQTFAEDRAARFPTGHPTILLALENNI